MKRNNIIIAKTRATKNVSSKNSIVNANLKPILKNPSGYVAQLTTTAKDIPTATIITLNKS